MTKLHRGRYYERTRGSGVDVLRPFREHILWGGWPHLLPCSRFSTCAPRAFFARCSVERRRSIPGETTIWCGCVFFSIYFFQSCYVFVPSKHAYLRIYTGQFSQYVETYLSLHIRSILQYTLVECLASRYESLKFTTGNRRPYVPTTRTAGRLTSVPCSRPCRPSVSCAEREHQSSVLTSYLSSKIVGRHEGAFAAKA